MNSVKIRLENEEYQPLLRLAEKLGLDPGDIAYAGLDRIMQQAGAEDVAQEIVRLSTARKSTLPGWADRSREIHAYESMT